MPSPKRPQRNMSRVQLTALTIGLVALFGCPGVASIRGPGRYNGVVIFDRWDECHLSSGVYVMEVSETVKEALRPWRGQAIALDAKEVWQPINPGDGLIKVLTVLGAADDAKTARPAPPVDDMVLRVTSIASGGRLRSFRISLTNNASETRAIRTRELAPTLYAKIQDPDEAWLLPVDGPSGAVITRSSIQSLPIRNRRFFADHGRRRVVVTLMPVQIVPERINLASGATYDVQLAVSLPPGEYEFFAGYGGGVHEARSIASNSIPFDISPSGRVKFIATPPTAATP